ncbi:MAG TPA: PAS domain S-box protein, partial [Rubrobacter sp.]|nr:PAS domain S-box protein [Rubrobacter sp.]
RYANPAWERALGYDPEQAVGTMNVLDHVHPDDLAHVLEETAEALAKRGVVTNEAEYRFRRKDGSWLWMQSVGTYLLDDPAVGGVVVASRDVTERKEAEEALRASEAEVFSVLESITDGFFSLDRELRFAYVNSGAELLLGGSREDLVGETIWEDPTFYPHYLRAVAEGETVEFEGYYPPLGAWYGVRAYPSASGLSVYFQDITERKEAEERLRFQAQLLGAVGEAVIALDTEGRVLYWNTAAEEMYGWSSEEIMGRRLRDMVVPEDLRGRAEEIAGQLRAGGSWAGEFEVRRRDGTTFSVEGTDTPVFGEDGGLVGVIGVLKDITERQGLEERLREAEVRYRTLVEHIPAVTYTDRIDDVSSAIYMSPQVEGMLGYTPEEWLEDPGLWPRILHPHDKERILAEARRTDETGDPFSVEYRAISKDGRVVWVRDEAVLVKDGRDTPLFWQGVIHDVTERKALEDRLEHRAFHDPLTDLPNRQLFVDRLGQALRRTRRHQGRVAVLFLDLDEFKVVNDSLGHEVGDLLLTVVAQRLGRCLRPEDTLARFGGDEFVVLLEAVDDPAEAVQVAERITGQLRRPFILKDRELHVAASIGLSLGHARTHEPDDLLREADTAMYRAKAEGSGYEVFDPAMHERALGRLELENDLRRAIEEDEFVVHYQPIVNLQTGELWGMEALVRWGHPERGLLNPDEFVRVAEESGLVVPMGELVLGEACRRAVEWQREFPLTPPLAVSVNLSARQLRRPDL